MKDLKFGRKTFSSPSAAQHQETGQLWDPSWSFKKCNHWENFCKQGRERDAAHGVCSDLVVPSVLINSRQQCAQDARRGKIHLDLIWSDPHAAAFFHQHGEEPRRQGKQFWWLDSARVLHQPASWSHCSDIPLHLQPAAPRPWSWELLKAARLWYAGSPADEASPYLLSLKTLKIIAGDLCAQGVLIPETSLNPCMFFSSVTSEHYIFISVWLAWHLHSRLGSGWAFFLSFFNPYGFRYSVRSLLGSH